MSLPRVFFDATVWISSLYKPSGFSGAIVGIALQHRFITITSSEIQKEVSRWISRQKKQLELSNHRVSLMQKIRPTSVAFAESDLSAWLEIPETDRHVITGAVKGDAEVLVSDNVRHLAKPSAKRAIPHILNPLQFLAWFRKFEEKAKADS